VFQVALILSAYCLAVILPSRFYASLRYTYVTHFSFNRFPYAYSSFQFFMSEIIVNHGQGRAFRTPGGEVFYSPSGLDVHPPLPSSAKPNVLWRTTIPPTHPLHIMLRPFTTTPLLRDNSPRPFHCHREPRRRSNGLSTVVSCLQATLPAPIASFTLYLSLRFEWTLLGHFVVTSSQAAETTVSRLWFCARGLLLPLSSSTLPYDVSPCSVAPTSPSAAILFTLVNVGVEAMVSRPSFLA
jgi:hypothetical protein